MDIGGNIFRPVCGNYRNTFKMRNKKYRIAYLILVYIIVRSLLSHISYILKIMKKQMFRTVYRNKILSAPAIPFFLNIHQYLPAVFQIY